MVIKVVEALELMISRTMQLHVNDEKLIDTD
jgi:hypothetical protein